MASLRPELHRTQLLPERIGYGVAVVFGPVADPKGPWGFGVIRVKSEEQMRKLVEHDPADLARIGASYEVLPMLNAVVAHSSGVSGLANHCQSRPMSAVTPIANKGECGRIVR
jgi:hypothetical protein